MKPLDSNSLEVALQKNVAQLGQLLKVDYCLLRPFSSDCLIKKSILYNKINDKNGITVGVLEKTIVPINKIETITCFNYFSPLIEVKNVTEKNRKEAPIFAI